RDEKTGLHRIAEVSRNPFQRSLALGTLSRYLHSTPNPLHLLYAIARDPNLRAYLWAPVSAEDWRGVPERRQVLLGELGLQPVKCGSDWLNQFAEDGIGVLTWFLRSHRQTPLTRFSALLYHLLNGEGDCSPLDWTDYKQTLGSLRDYPGGAEILESLTILARFAKVGDLSDLKIALETISESSTTCDPGEGDSQMAASGLIRPEVLSAIGHLAEIGTLVSGNSDSTDSGQRLATLARATVALDTLESEAIASFVTPELGIFQQIIRQWRLLFLRETAATAKTVV
ncbi:MAG: hypothetical protein ACRC8Y_14635, partial [Chroococcales cyanobacterium]